MPQSWPYQVVAGEWDNKHVDDVVVGDDGGCDDNDGGDGDCCDGVGVVTVVVVNCGGDNGDSRSQP